MSRSTVIAALMLGAMLVLAGFGAGFTFAEDYTPPPVELDPFNEDTFPCQEDEVLGYSPEAEEGKVICIHRDTL